MEKRLALNITTNYFCNQKCFFCIDHDKHFLSFLKSDADKQIYKMMDDWVWKYENIVFTSWEPTLNLSLWEYISYAKDKWYKDISLITNWSTLNNESIRNKIIESWLDEIVISIHGLWKLHDKTVWINWMFDNVLKWLYLLLQNRKKWLKISLSFVMSSLNYKILYKYIDFFINLGIDQIIINTLRPEWYSSWDNYSKFFFSFEDFISFYKNSDIKQLTYINELISRKKIFFIDMLPCIMKQAWFLIEWVGTVEIRSTFSTENWEDWNILYWKKDINKTYRKIWDELIDNNNLHKEYIDECNKCTQKNKCEWINIYYLKYFWEKGILAIK